MTAPSSAASASTITTTNIDPPTTPPPPPSVSPSPSHNSPISTTTDSSATKQNEPTELLPCCPPLHVKTFSTYLPQHALYRSKLHVKIKPTDDYVGALSKILQDIDQWIDEQQKQQQPPISNSNSSSNTHGAQAVKWMTLLLTEANNRHGPLIDDETVEVVQIHIRVLHHLHQLNQIRLNPTIIYSLNILAIDSFSQLFAPRIHELISTHFQNQGSKHDGIVSDGQAYMDDVTKEIDQCEEFINDYVLMQYAGTSMTSNDVILKVQNCSDGLYDRLTSILHQHQPRWIGNDCLLLFHLKMMSQIHRLDYILSPTLIHMQESTYKPTKMLPFVSHHIWEVPRLNDLQQHIQRMVRLHCDAKQKQQQYQELLKQVQALEIEYKSLEEKKSHPDNIWLFNTYPDSLLSSMEPPSAHPARLTTAAATATTTTTTTTCTLSSSSSSSSSSLLSTTPAPTPTITPTITTTTTSSNQLHSHTYTQVPSQTHATIMYFGDKYDSISRDGPLQAIQLKIDTSLSNKSQFQQRWKDLQTLCNIQYDQQDVSFIIYDSVDQKATQTLDQLEPGHVYHLYYYHNHRPGRYIIYNLFDKDTLAQNNQIPQVSYFNFIRKNCKGLTDAPDPPIKTTMPEAVKSIIDSFKLASATPISIYRSKDGSEWERVIGTSHIDRQSYHDRNTYYYYIAPKNEVFHTIDSRSKSDAAATDDDDLDDDTKDVEEEENKEGDNEKEESVDGDGDDGNDSSDKSKRKKALSRVKRKLSMSLVEYDQYGDRRGTKRKMSRYST